MMKRCILLFLILMMLAVPVLAQFSRAEDEAGKMLWMEFDDQLPPEARAAFSSVCYTRALCGMVA